MSATPPGLFHVPQLVDAVTDKKKISITWGQLFTNLFNLINQGYPPPKNNINGQLVPQSLTIPIAKLTGGGANGSLTFTNGILTAMVAPT